MMLKIPQGKIRDFRNTDSFGGVSLSIRKCFHKQKKNFGRIFGRNLSIMNIYIVFSTSLIYILISTRTFIWAFL